MEIDIVNVFKYILMLQSDAKASVYWQTRQVV